MAAGRRIMTRQEFIKDYLPLSEALFRVAYYILEDSGDAEDAVQDLFMKIWTSELPGTVGNPKAYCITMMRNLCIDRIRRERNIRREPLSDTAMADEDIIRTTESRETLDRVARAIDSLPESQRNILTMRAFENLSYEEISHRTGMNALTLRVLLSQARRKLKREL